MINSVMSAGYVQSVLFPQQNSSQSLIETDPASDNKAGTDTITISDKSRLLSNLLPSVGGTTISIEDIETSLANTTVSVEKRLQSLCRQLGIDPDSKIEFSVGHDGKIEINGESPESERLAAAINEDDELSNSIRQMSADASLLEAFKKHQEFTEAYENDPVAAMQRYSDLFEDGHDYDVTFSMQDGHIDAITNYL